MFSSNLIIFFLFLTGLSVGSFLNVVIDRVPNNKSIFFGRSHCDHCKKRLSWLDLIPIFSFILLKAKCRQCRNKIGFQYPAVEGLTAVFFIFVFLNSLPSLALNYPIFVFNLFLVAALISLFFADLKYGIIPDKILLPLTIVSILTFAILKMNLVIPHLIAGLASFLFFLTLHIITKGKGLGLGDVKLSFLIGFLLGFPSFVISLYLSFLTGAIVSIILVLWGKKRFHGGTIPFGPFLIFSLLLVYFSKDYLTHLVLNLLGI